MKIKILDEQGNDIASKLPDNLEFSMTVSDEFKKGFMIGGTVIKEAQLIAVKGSFHLGGQIMEFIIPAGAKNIKCTYEITEDE